MKYKRHNKYSYVGSKDIEIVHALQKLGINACQIANTIKRSQVIVELIMKSKDLTDYKIVQREFWKSRQQPTAKVEEKKPEVVYKASSTDSKVDELIESNLRLEAIINILLEKVNRFLAVFEK